jgi:hypothetical protein
MRNAMHSFRNTRRNRAFAALCGTLAFISLATGIAFALLPVLGGTDEPLMALWAPVHLAGAWALIRAARGSWFSELLLFTGQVVVRGPWRTQRIPLADVAGFTHGMPHGSPGVLLNLVDGPHVAIWTLASDGFIWNNERNAKRWARMAETLNALLEDLRE